MGGAGNDTFSGSFGNDTASFEHASAAVTAHLANGTATGAGLPTPSRLCILDPRPASDLLTLASPSSSDRCRVRLTITSSPGWPTARARAWLPWVEPATENRHQSAPHRPAAACSARPSSASAYLIVSRPP